MESKCAAKGGKGILCVHKSTYVKINKKEIHFFFNLFVSG